MGFWRRLGRLLWRFMVIFSFVVNLVLVAVLLGAGLLIFEIKNAIADPLIGGLHSTAIGLRNATIDWTIPVRDNIPVNLDIELQTDTVVVLNAPVPLTVQAIIDLPGLNAQNVPATVSLQLPAGLQLPVKLDVPVPVRERLDVSLDVRAVIPLSETQLADPINTLGLLFEPLAIALHNLPSNWGEAGELVGLILGGKLGELNLLATDGTGGINDSPYVPWDGYSRTAGLNYALFDQPVPPGNLPLATGLVPPGGIPFLDELLPGRDLIYDQGGVRAVNQQAAQALAARGIPPQFFNGTMSAYYNSLQAQARGQQAGSLEGVILPPEPPISAQPPQTSPPTIIEQPTGGPQQPPPIPTQAGDFAIVPPSSP